MSDAVVRLTGVDYRAGHEFAIRNLSLTVPRGAVYGFLGPNGSGKTTTIRLLLGVLAADAGRIEVLGHAVPQDVHRALGRIGYVPERLHLWPHLSVGQMMATHAAAFPSWDAARAEELRQRFELRLAQRLAQLSKGESGKLMMLLALSTRPELLVLDEPTDGLDPVVRRDVLATLVEYVATTEASVLISSHLVHEQERICDWVGVMDGGALVAELPMQEFRSGIKRLQLQDAPAVLDAAPFALLAREASVGRGEQWVVRGWQDAHAEWLTARGATLRSIDALDLEESFVELLRSGRTREALR
jgi:ABC-2 type transport system ATP-binding protein